MYTIKKKDDDCYLIFERGVSEPMDETSETHLEGWLKNRGLPEADARELIRLANSRGWSITPDFQ
jgi:hypothetical protein